MHTNGYIVPGNHGTLGKLSQIHQIKVQGFVRNFLCLVKGNKKMKSFIILYSRPTVTINIDNIVGGMSQAAMLRLV